MAIRFILTAACLAVTFVSGFGPAAVVQKSRLTTPTAATTPLPSVASKFTLAAVLDNDVDSSSGKIYSTNSKETPKVLGGVKIGLRKLVVITGASSGLGLSTTIALAKTGKYHIVMACRNIEKAKKGESNDSFVNNCYKKFFRRRVDRKESVIKARNSSNHSPFYPFFRSLSSC